MMIALVGISCYMFGFLVLFLTDLFPLFRVFYMHWFAGIFFVLPFVYCVYRMKMGDCYKQVDGGFPRWKHLIYYLRRDNHVIPLVGERAFPGESFVDIPKLGIMEFLGKDCVYTWGDKKIVWGLENINFTPDPRYFNFNHLLWSIGFRNSDDVVRVLNGLDLERMGKIYMRMLEWDSNHGVRRLIRDMEGYNKKTIDFTPSKRDELLMKKKEKDRPSSIEEKVDSLWK